MRSFTEAEGLKLSNLATTSAQRSNSAGNRFNRTSGCPNQGRDVGRNCHRINVTF